MLLYSNWDIAAAGEIPAQNVCIRRGVAPPPRDPGGDIFPLKIVFKIARIHPQQKVWEAWLPHCRMNGYQWYMFTKLYQYIETKH